MAIHVLLGGGHIHRIGGGHIHRI
ncbi:unnamed protein product, partial [Rotaria sp. Silwood1]